MQKKVKILPDKFNLQSEQGSEQSEESKRQTV